MSAGICGKRLGLEEIFGSPAPAPSAKRSRCSSYGSPVRPSDFGIASDDKVTILLRMFPSMDREVVETVLKTHDHKIDDAIRSLHALCLGNDSTRAESARLNSILQANENDVEGVSNYQTSKQKVEGTQNDSLDSEARIPQDVPSWVDIFVQEMMNASNWDDVRGRAMKILEAFERNVVAQTTASVEEIASLKEQLQCLLRDNQILKRAVAIQYERNMEHEKELKEVQQLKQIISQYQEQIQTLELNNYTLKIHLQRAQESSSIPGQFHPDIF
ncbi:uncharacterized protein LOC103703441 isoform X2 [Phoenix dactylifera]|uniref:Uncharacterized protein LOC103703441 isoform X2 n=1 Tax=Phoenix dactylifera TaxID=42345 RepID=A0A8B7BSL1_PHODC|nr:uncharacterized protein LOC103703441 isoform X2 [Phoenix dactylifera]